MSGLYSVVSPTAGDLGGDADLLVETGEDVRVVGDRSAAVVVEARPADDGTDDDSAAGAVVAPACGVGVDQAADRAAAVERDLARRRDDHRGSVGAQRDAAAELQRAVDPECALAMTDIRVDESRGVGESVRPADDVG